MSSPTTRPTLLNTFFSLFSGKNDSSKTNDSRTDSGKSQESSKTYDQRKESVKSLGAHADSPQKGKMLTRTGSNYRTIANSQRKLVTSVFQKDQKKVINIGTLNDYQENSGKSSSGRVDSAKSSSGKERSTKDSGAKDARIDYGKTSSPAKKLKGKRSPLSPGLPTLLTPSKWKFSAPFSPGIHRRRKNQPRFSLFGTPSPSKRKTSVEKKSNISPTSPNARKFHSMFQSRSISRGSSIEGGDTDFCLTIAPVEIHAREWKEGCKSTKFVMKVPVDAEPGALITNIGGRKNMSLRLPEYVYPGETVILIAPESPTSDPESKEEELTNTKSDGLRRADDVKGGPSTPTEVTVSTAGSTIDGSPIPDSSRLISMLDEIL